MAAAYFDDNSVDSSFVETNEAEINELLEGSKAKNTNRSTNTSVTRFKSYLKHRKLPDIDDIGTEELPNILTRFYTDVRTKKSNEQYQTSSFKVLRAGLNRYFKKTRTVDIVSDEKFMRANMIFDSVQVKAKKMGKGRIKSTPHIDDCDLKKISAYFNIDHIMRPSPKILQQCVQFYIMYFFCRRGQENLYTMTKDHFKVVVQYDGSKYVEQNLDEKDKNHGVQDLMLANQGRMYEDKGD